MSSARRSVSDSAATRRFRWLVGVAGALLALAACGDGATGPGAIEGAYVLQLLNSQPLPYDHEGLGCCTYLSGTLSLGGGDYAMAITARNRNTAEVFTAEEWGKYTRLASSLTFAPDSYAVAGLLLDAGTAANDSLRVAFGGEGPGSPDQFNAVFVRGP